MANYSLRDNPLTEDPNDKLPQLEGVRSFTKEEIIERILKRGNTMTRTDLLAAINAYAEEIAFITEEGNTVNTPLLNTSLSISGVFVNGEDSFDPRRHTLKINAQAGTALKAGSVIELTGARLKFDTADSEQGVFFIGEDGEIRLSQVVENKPSRVLALLPADTAAGTYTVEVRTKNTGNKTDGKALKRGSFDRTVTVA